MRTTWLSRLAGLYLFAWFGLFVLAIIFDDQIMAWLVMLSADLPLWLVAVMGWAPFSGAIVSGALGSIVRPGNPVRRNLGISAALFGLVIAVQTPVVFNRRSSDAYDVLAATRQGEALIMGAVWAWGPIFAAFLLFLTARWAVNRWNGGKRKFRDDSWVSNARTSRMVGTTAMAISIGSLIGALLTA